MSHVDDGTLHAYLDGELEAVQPGASAALEAHIAACGECRARLEDERRIRDRASAILGHAEPAGLEVPPFDAVLQRARGNVGGDAAPGSRPRRSFTLPLAWAASIVLALAGGWWAREMALAPESAADRAEAYHAVTGTDPETTLAPAVAQARSAGSAAPQADASAKPSAARQAGPEAAQEPGLAAEAMRTQMQDDATPPSTPPRRAIAGREMRREAPAGVSAFAPRSAADSSRPVVPEAAVSALTVRSEALLLAPVVPGGGAVQWSAVDRAEAERRLGGRLLLVEELEVESIELADSGGVPLVRTRQAVAPGVTLVLLQHTTPRAVPGELVADTVRAALQAPRERTEKAEPAPAELVVERNGFRVRLSANLPQDSLRALAARLR